MKHLALLLISCGSVLVFAAEKPSADVIGRWAGGKWVGDSQSVETEYQQSRFGQRSLQLRLVSRPHLCLMRPERERQWQEDAFSIRIRFRS